MIIERKLTDYLVLSDESIATGLAKITANKARIVFVVSANGVLVGSLTDGDFRRWLSQQRTPDFTVPVSQVCKLSPIAVDQHSAPSSIQAKFAPPVTHIPLVDQQRRVVAIAITGPPTLTIGKHQVDSKSPTLIISEIGNNHQGSVDLAKELVDKSIASGADIVKFQLRDLDAVYRQSGAASAGEDLAAQYTLQLLEKFNLSAQQLFEVFDYAKAAGTEIMCTAWDANSAHALTEYGIDSLKVASADLTNHQLISKLIDCQKPLLLSTGMATETEIIETIGLLKNNGANFALLHCQSAYPAPFKDLNLNYLPRLAELGQCPVGYSGHERGFHVPIAAVALGAKIIEKHFTIDKNLEGNDHIVSLLPTEFAEMVSRIREVEISLGSAKPREISTGESMNRANLAKSLVADQPLKTGEVITAAAVAVRSPGRGIQPNQLTKLLGRKASRDFQVGDFFFPSDLAEQQIAKRNYQFQRPWGLPVRYHDWTALAEGTNPDFLEFHFSFKDIEIDPDDIFDQQLPYSFTTHAPDLYAGDFLINLATPDAALWERSIYEVQQVINRTRELTKYFTVTAPPVVVVTMGGFLPHTHLKPGQRAPLYDRIATGLAKLDQSEVNLVAQTLPPYPWLMGGQQHHNLFLDPSDTADFCKNYEQQLCLDISHTQLAANFLGIDLITAVTQLSPYLAHLHLVDGSGVDGEGVQIGDGDVAWAQLAAFLNKHNPGIGFIPEIWQGHTNHGEGFWHALEKLEAWF